MTVLDREPPPQAPAKRAPARGKGITSTIASAIGETVEGYEASAFFGLAVPKGTPAPVVQFLYEQIQAALRRGEQVTVWNRTAAKAEALGRIAEDRGEFDQSRRLHEEALALLQPETDPFWTASLRRDMGWASFLAGDPRGELVGQLPDPVAEPLPRLHGPAILVVGDRRRVGVALQPAMSERRVRVHGVPPRRVGPRRGAHRTTAAAVGARSDPEPHGTSPAVTGRGRGPGRRCR